MGGFFATGVGLGFGIALYTQLAPATHQTFQTAWFILCAALLIAYIAGKQKANGQWQFQIQEQNQEQEQTQQQAVIVNIQDSGARLGPSASRSEVEAPGASNPALVTVHEVTSLPSSRETEGQFSLEESSRKSAGSVCPSDRGQTALEKCNVPLEGSPDLSRVLPVLLKIQRRIEAKKFLSGSSGEGH